MQSVSDESSESDKEDSTARLELENIKRNQQDFINRRRLMFGAPVIMIERFSSKRLLKASDQ